MKQSLSHRLKVGCLMFTLVLISGCFATSGNFVKLRYDDHVKQTFESFTVNPAYNYYYWGPISFPKAVVGISKDYDMVSNFWKPVDLTPEHLRDWVWGQANRKPGDLQRYGSNMIGPNGERVGVWYSLQNWQQWARIELTDNRMVKIGGPINNNRKKRAGGMIQF